MCYSISCPLCFPKVNMKNLKSTAMLQEFCRNPYMHHIDSIINVL